MCSAFYLSVFPDNNPLLCGQVSLELVAIFLPQLPTRWSTLVLFGSTPFYTRFQQLMRWWPWKVNTMMQTPELGGSSGGRELTIRPTGSIYNGMLNGFKLLIQTVGSVT